MLKLHPDNDEKLRIREMTIDDLSDVFHISCYKLEHSLHFLAVEIFEHFFMASYRQCLCED
jgi:hypothetical protein